MTHPYLVAIRDADTWKFLRWYDADDTGPTKMALDDAERLAEDLNSWAVMKGRNTRYSAEISC